MNTIALYEDWIKKHSALDYSSDSIDYRVNYMNVWGKLGINSNELLKEGCMAGFSLKEFKERFVSHLNESKDYDQILDTYSLYELNLLKTERSDWFKDDSKIVSIPNHSEAKVILFKNESLFIISTNTWRMINEGWLDDMIEKGKKIAGDVWDTLAKGAQEVYGFLAKLDSDIQKLTGMDIYATTAIAINILAAIIAFVPAFGQAAAPILTSIAGGIEVVGGMSKIKKGYEKISKVDDPIVKSMAAIGEGAPYLTVGAITIFFGLGDVISSIKSAAPGAAGIMASTKTAAKKLGDKMHHSMLGEAEKGFVKTVASLAKKKITSEGIVKNVSKAGAAIGLVFMVKGLKSILGGFADLVVESLGLVGKGIDFLLSIPSKISELIGKISSDNSSTVVKLIGNALKLAVKPITDAMSKFIDQGVKPIVSPLTEWLKKLPEQYKIAKEEIEKNLKGIPDTPVEIKKRDIKAKEVKISKEDKEKIQKLQKSGKKNESILPFEDWNSLGFV